MNIDYITPQIDLYANIIELYENHVNKLKKLSKIQPIEMDILSDTNLERIQKTDCVDLNSINNLNTNNLNTNNLNSDDSLDDDYEQEQIWARIRRSHPTEYKDNSAIISIQSDVGGIIVSNNIFDNNLDTNSSKLIQKKLQVNNSPPKRAPLDKFVNDTKNNQYQLMIDIYSKATYNIQQLAELDNTLNDELDKLISDEADRLLEQYLRV